MTLWWQWGDCHGFGCRCPGCAAVSTITTTFQQTSHFDTWAEAVAHALRLRRTGEASGKPRVWRGHPDGRWVVSWTPLYVAYLPPAYPTEQPAV